MDSGREVEFNAKQHPHLDYGYAVTSHSSQGQTADRVLIHVDSSQAHGELLNSRMAYVSVSRAQFDVQMYTNDAKTLGQQLSRDVSHPSAIQQTSQPTGMQQQTPTQPDATPEGHGAEDRTAAGGNGTLAGLEPQPVIIAFIATERASFKASSEAVLDPPIAIAFALFHTVSCSAADRNSLPA